jgi:hypothetical protein
MNAREAEQPGAMRKESLMASATRVCLEQGRTWVFASALDWPGWCRRGKGDEAALDVLLDYADRYALVAGAGFEPGTVEVVGCVKGNRTTDFGAPDARGPWDDERLDPRRPTAWWGCSRAPGVTLMRRSGMPRHNSVKAREAEVVTGTQSPRTSARPNALIAPGPVPGFLRVRPRRCAISRRRLCAL